MSVLVEGLTLVIRKLQLDIAFPGGAEAFGNALLGLPKPPRFVCIADADLVNVGFYDPDHLRPAAEMLVEHGLIAVDDNAFVDFAYVDQHHGPSMPCSWLEWRRHKEGFTYAWLTGTGPAEMAVYEGWTPEASRSMQRFDIRDEPDRVMPLGNDEGLEYGLDFKTGEIMAALPHRDLNPADGPLPTARSHVQGNAAEKEIDLDAIIAELEEEFPEGPLLSVVRQVLEEDGFEFDRVWPNQIDVQMLSVVGGMQTASIETDVEQCYINIRIILPSKVPEAGRPLAAEAVARANWRLSRGAIDFDMDDGELAYRDALVVTDGTVSPKAIRIALYDSIYVFDRYIPAILKAAAGTASPAAAVAEADALAEEEESDDDDAAPSAGAVTVASIERPLPNSYRVPGTRLFAGEYPFSSDAEDGRAKLTRCIDAGITAFIDLTEDADGLAPYAPSLDDFVTHRGISVRHIPNGFRDMSVPSTEKMRQILDAIDAELAAGRAVYVHCWGGVGRTGVVIGCHLVRQGMTGEQALKVVGELFHTMSSDKVARHRRWGSPQTEEQRRFVRAWSEPKAKVAFDRAVELLLPSGWSPPASVLQGHASPLRAKLALRDRIRGALIGLAVGDALGTTNEFKAPGTFSPIADMVGGGPFQLKPGQWTDDTSMALCLAESLIERRDFDAADQMQRYVRWMREGHLSSTGTCFDIGNTTRDALRRFEREKTPFVGSTERSRAANGSLMRLAPVPMLYWQDPQAMAHAGTSSRTTHGSPLPVDACRYLAALIVGAIRGATRAELLAPFYSPVPGLWEQSPLEPEVAAIAAGSFRNKQPPQIRGTGYCVDALEAALWAFHSSTDFRAGALLAVNLGDDADTTGAIYGQIAGAFYGESAIPEEWRTKLALSTAIDSYAETLFQLSLRLLPELSDERKKNAQDLVKSALDEFGSPVAALDEIMRMREAEKSEMGVMEFYMSGSMGAQAAEEEALMQLRVQHGLALAQTHHQ